MKYRATLEPPLYSEGTQLEVIYYVTERLPSSVFRTASGMEYSISYAWYRSVLRRAAE
jgi:hypothetical protein